IVEQNNFEIEIAPHRMQKMISTDAKSISISSDYPNVQIRIARFDSGSDRRSAAMNAMHSVGIHVIRETAGASDSGHKHKFFASNTQIGKNFLRLRENRIISAARAPSDLLVRHEILSAGFGRGNCCCTHNQLSKTSSTLSMISEILNGLPFTFE